jgi:hypothetical protein
MASAVRNHVADGLNGISSTSFLWSSYKTKYLTTSAVIVKLSAGVVDIKLTQRIDGIRIEMETYQQIALWSLL